MNICQSTKYDDSFACRTRKCQCLIAGETTFNYKWRHIWRVLWLLSEIFYQIFAYWLWHEAEEKVLVFTNLLTMYHDRITVNKRRRPGMTWLCIDGLLFVQENVKRDLLPSNSPAVLGSCYAIRISQP